MSTTSLRRSLALAAVALALPWTAYGAVSRTNDASVSFTASGPGGLKLIGSTPELGITDEPTGWVVTVPLGNMTTGIALRDRHMRDKYLEVSTYPNATLLLGRADVTVPPAGGHSEGDASGTLTLHGRARPVVFHYGIRHDASIYTVTGSLRVNMKDYGIEVPSYLGVGVKPDVDVSVRFQAKDDT